MTNYVVWFDIPVADIERASDFYSAVLGVELQRQEFEGTKIGVFPHDQKSGVAGCIVQSEDQTPSDCGPLLYLNVNGRLDDAVAKAQEKGGEVIKKSHQIGEYGFRAIVKDSEGNRIALHSD